MKRDDVTEEEAETCFSALSRTTSTPRACLHMQYPAKGAGQDKYAADGITADVAWLGYPRVIPRSDNEPALVQIVTNALKLLRVQIADQKEGQPPAAAEGLTTYDHQPNGAIEQMVGLVRGGAE